MINMLLNWSSPSVLAQSNDTEETATTAEPILEQEVSSEPVWMYSTIGLGIILIALLIYGKLQLDKANKAIKYEKYKSKDLKKKLKLALDTIKKMERNPDLVHSREFNLDYLRMRMDEEVFHYVIVNQIKMKVKQLVTEALRPDTKEVSIGIEGTGRKIDKLFDVTYEIEEEGKYKKNILFRIQIKLTKLPLQFTKTTVDEIIGCVESFLCPEQRPDNWTPAIHGKVMFISWDQKARPTPLLVLEQSEEGVNVTMKNKNWGSDSKKSGNPQYRL